MNCLSKYFVYPYVTSSIGFKISSNTFKSYDLSQDNLKLSGFELHNPVFVVSAVFIVVFISLALVFQVDAKAFFTWLRPELTGRFDWLLLIAGNSFVAVCLLLIVSPWGKVRLGGQAARPDYSYPGWFAMLFAAGMGIGLVFFGVLEPVQHFREPPLQIGSQDIELTRSTAMAATIFHWGLHPWAIYAVVGLSLAYFHYNHGLPLTPRSAFRPLFGEAIWGWPGHIIDVLAVLATLFGLATSLGFGAEQVAAGLNYLFDVPATNFTKVLLIAGITSMAIASVVAGLNAGVKRVSEITMLLALLLAVVVLFSGPTTTLLETIPHNLASYVQNLPAFSSWTGRDDLEFVHGWTTFYWAWWISWSPFVGMFIARVSRGRTVREFLLCVMIVPTLVSVIWMSVFGGLALHQLIHDGYQGVLTTLTSWQPELSLFKMLDPLPYGGWASLIAVLVITLFFVTSSDSGSLVIDTITAGGKLHPPTAQRVFWASIEGLVAISLLLGGGLAALQAAVISMGIPFAIVLLVMCGCTITALRNEVALSKHTDHTTGAKV
jgi:betaine/carnitine transporter, BCCT family